MGTILPAVCVPRDPNRVTFVNVMYNNDTGLKIEIWKIAIEPDMAIAYVSRLLQVSLHPAPIAITISYSMAFDETCYDGMCEIKTVEF